MIYDEKKKKQRDTQTYNEKYNEDIQRLYLNMLLGDPEVFAICRSILRPEYFDNRLKDAVAFILEYADENKTLPAVEMVRAKTGVIVEKFSESDNPQHAAYLKNEIEAFIQYKAMEITVLDSIELLQSGRASEIVERAKEALCISLNSDLGTEYFSDPETRLKKMLDRSAYVSTGWNALDKKLYGGFTRGGLNVFAGGSGSGKSLFLQNLSLNWSLAGYTVLYISLELSEDLVAMRLDSMITGRATKEVMSDISGTVICIRNEQRKQKPGGLYIKTMGSGTTVNTLLGFMKEFQIKTGKKPDAVVIDYLDLMSPNNTNINLSDQFVKDKYVSEEIRGLMHETNTFGATASQLNRQIHDESIVGKDGMPTYNHSHIAGGLSKINTADNVFGIITNATMKEKGIYVLQFLKTRTAPVTGQTMTLSYDNSCMRIADPIEQIEDLSAPTSKETLKEQLKSNMSIPKPNFKKDDSLVDQVKTEISKDPNVALARFQRFKALSDSK